LISKAKTSHAFKSSLIDFFDCLMYTMYETGVLYDDVALYENIELWVTTMTSSFLRPFRHTSLLIALTITTSLCKISLEQAESTAKSLRQMEGEKKKKSSKGTIAALKQKVDQGNERGELCAAWIKAWFDQVFVHRYRDIDAKIRTECVEALGQWIVTLPGTFLEGAYLRYLGWMLSDPSAPTRHEAVNQLERIMKSIGEKGALREFIERFRPRVVEMAGGDSETNVRVSAIDLLDLLREAGMLEPDDIDAIGKLIFDSEPKVRKAVVGFFAENINDLYESKIEELGGEEILEEALQEDDEEGEKPCAEWIKLKCIAEVLFNYDSSDRDDFYSQDEGLLDSDTLKASGVDSRFSLAAQALYDKIPEIREWKKLAGYLLFDHSVPVHSKSSAADTLLNVRKSFRLEEEEEAILLEILDAAVKLSLAQSDEHTKDKSKKKFSKADLQEIQESAARRLALIIPRLLSKFGANAKTTTAVLRLEQLLNLNVFQALRMEGTAYPDLLREIGVQFRGHSDRRVLDEARQALLHARSCEELEEITEESMQTLWDDTVEDMRNRVQNFSKAAGFTARGDLSVEHLTEVGSTVTRVSKLASIINPIDSFEAIPKASKAKGNKARTPLIQVLIEIISRGVLKEADAEIDDLEDALVTAACRSVQFYFMWKTHTLQTSVAKSAAVSDADIDALRERLDAFKDSLFNVLSSRGGLDDLRLLATGTLLDVHILFSTIIPPKKSQNRDTPNADTAGTDQYANLQNLVQQIRAEVQVELMSIFVAVEKQYAKKARKALESPADDEEPEDIESESEGEEEDEMNDVERQSESLKSELKLCDLAGRLVFAILAGVIDASGPMKGKLRTRIQRNRLRLGPNFREIVSKLENHKKKGETKSHKTKAQQAAAAAKTQPLSAERVEDHEEEDPFAEEEAEEEDGEEDLRRRELLDDDPPQSVDDEEGDNVGGGGDDEDDIMGD
jgi:cohesin complex subunit SA-1/2